LKGEIRTLARITYPWKKNAVALATRISCTTDEIEVLSIGSRLHDLGKVSLSEHILNRPARLTAAEFSLVKQHSEFGGQLLSPLGPDPRISEIAVFHHENADGTGYPKGLSKSDIPFLARIIRIADTFDALTVDRPYHQGVSLEKALRILQDDARLYDPELLTAFCKVMDTQERG
jgi:HD-GYP domain-containing protein (c-di-GMP phosphodiesterase class II)